MSQQLIMPEEITQLLRSHLGEDAMVTVQTEDGVHFTVTVVAALFAGLPLLKRHRLIYAHLQPWLETGKLHAVQLQTRTPEEVGKV